MRDWLGATLRVTLPIAVAFALGFILFAATGYDVADVIDGLWQGAVAAPGSLEQSVRWAIPLAIVSLGIIITLRTGEFNIGAQGQLLLGGLGAVAIPLLFSDWPPFVVIPLAIVCGIIAGAIWSGIAGLLKVWFNSDEVINTLMLNFIAVLLIQWFTTGPFKDDSTRGENASTPRIDRDFRLSDGAGVSDELIFIVIVVAILAWIIIERTPFGLKSKLVGSSPKVAAWQGLQIKRIHIMTYLLAGGFAGLAGALEVLGPSGRLVTGATPTLGFTAIVVAIVGTLRVPGAILAALFFGGLQAAILFLPIVTNLPSSGLRIIEGLVALLITAQFIWRRRSRARAAQQTAVTHDEEGR